MTPDDTRSNNFNVNPDVNDIVSKIKQCDLITNIETHFVNSDKQNPHIEFQIKSRYNDAPDERGPTYSKSVIKLNDDEHRRLSMYNTIGEISIRYPALFINKTQKEKRFKKILERSHPPRNIDEYRYYFDSMDETTIPHFKTASLEEQNKENHQLSGSSDAWANFIKKSAIKFENEFLK